MEAIMLADRMTSEERMKALIEGKEIDRVPVNPFIQSFAAKISGIPFKEFFADPEKCLNVQLLTKELYGHDGGFSFGWTDKGAWEFGGKISYPDSNQFTPPRNVDNPVKTPEDVDRLPDPDPKKAGQFPKMMEFARLLRKKGLPINLYAGSPSTMAASVIGKERMLRWYYKEPEALHKVMRKVTDFILRNTDWFIGEFGAASITANTSVPMETNQLISPRMFREFAFPYICEIHEKLIAKGVKRFFIHLCGDHERNLPFWEDIPITQRSIISIGSEMDIEKTAAFFGEDYIIGGNVPTTLLQIGSFEEVQEASKECILKGRKHKGGYILMPACDLPPLTPPINVYAMMKAARMCEGYVPGN